jgi:hypothetical protein
MPYQSQGQGQHLYLIWTSNQFLGERHESNLMSRQSSESLDHETPTQKPIWPPRALARDCCSRRTSALCGCDSRADSIGCWLFRLGLRPDCSYDPPADDIFHLRSNKSDSGRERCHGNLKRRSDGHGNGQQFWRLHLYRISKRGVHGYAEPYGLHVQPE